MKAMLFCDALARGLTSAALKIPGENTAVYTLADMVVSYGAFLKLYSTFSQVSGRRSDLSPVVVISSLAGFLARVAGIFAGFAAALALDCPVRLTDAIWMSGASTVAVVVIHLIKTI